RSERAAAILPGDRRRRRNSARLYLADAPQRANGRIWLGGVAAKAGGCGRARQLNRGASSRQRLDHAPDLFEDFADLAFAHDQRWRDRDRVPDDAEHDALVVEAALHRLEAAFADAVGTRGEIDAGGEANAADVEHTGHAFERHRG